MNYDDSTIIDSNGTKYAVGWNQGWFDIQHVDIYEDEDGEKVITPVNPKSPVVSFTPSGAEKLMKEIRDK